MGHAGFVAPLARGLRTGVGAVSYCLPGKTGNLYRFDGWSRIATGCGSVGGGTWSGRRAYDDLAASRDKTLWAYRVGALVTDPSTV